MVRLSSVASARRLAHTWIDLSDDKRKERLSLLDTESRVAVIEEMVKIRITRGRRHETESR